MAKNLYEILGVPKTASDDDIKKAYRKKVVAYHPDKFAGASEKEKKDAEAMCKEINHAYEVLSNKEKTRQLRSIRQRRRSAGIWRSGRRRRGLRRIRGYTFLFLRRKFRRKEKSERAPSRRGYPRQSQPYF